MSRYVAFLDLDKAYTMFDKEGLWKVKRMRGVNGKLLLVVTSFYSHGKSCVGGQID